MSEGYFRFLCPHCGEMRATVNPKNNLAHCFSCKKNLNNIDLLLKLDYPFLKPLPSWNACSKNTRATTTHRPSRQQRSSRRLQANLYPLCRSLPSATGLWHAAPARRISSSHSFSKILSNSVNQPLSGRNPYSINLATSAITIRPGTSHTVWHCHTVCPATSEYHAFPGPLAPPAQRTADVLPISPWAATVRPRK